MVNQSSSNAQIALLQIAQRLHEVFDGLIVLNNLPQKSADDLEQNFLTRAFAALYLIDSAGIDPALAASAICDDGDDDGIDAIHIDHRTQKIYFGQSKWKKSGSGGIKLNEFTRFRDGIINVLDGNWGKWNKSLHRFRGQIETALKDINVEVVAFFAHTSTEAIAENISDKIKDFVVQQNKFNPEFLRFEEFRINEATRAARFAARPATIDIDLMLSNWGMIHDPYRAVYGHVAADDLEKLFAANGNRLFAENFRYGIEKSEVNEGIIGTAKSYPENFWYYNNGITAICDTVDKLPFGGNDTGSGIFSAKKLSVINGAQTISSLYKAKANGASLDRVRVHLRVISLKDTPDDFAERVTSANNTQNDLNPVDFVASDPNQDRLRRELDKLGRLYVYRRGESSPKLLKDGFDIRLATIALACASGDLRLATQAKRYISGLWENIKKEPYVTLFSETTTGAYILLCVDVMGRVDGVLDDEAKKKERKEKLIAVHGNRFILFCVFEEIKKTAAWANGDLPRLIKAVEAVTKKTLKDVTDYILRNYPDAYPGNFFKNQEKQTEVRTYLIDKFKMDQKDG